MHLHRYALDATTGSDLGLVEHPASNAVAGDAVVLEA